MTACSRCGATDDRHSIKCYQAMALGMAMGVEPPSRATVLADVGTYDAALREEDARLREQNLALVQENRSLRERLDAQSGGRGWPAVVRELRTTLDERDATIDSLRRQLAEAVPVTHLPAGYYDGKASPERLAEIQREVEELNASPHLDVQVLDPLNAIVTPRPEVQHIPLRDDDYTPEAVDRASEIVAEIVESHRPAPPEPKPKPERVDWPALVRKLRTDRGMSTHEFAGLVGCSRQAVRDWESGKVKSPGERWQDKLRALQAAPAKRHVPKVGAPGPRTTQETADAEQAIREFMEAHLVAAGGTRTAENGVVWEAYVTAPELLAAYEAWAKANGKPIPKAAHRMVGSAATKSPAVRKKRQGPVHGGSKPNSYFGVKLALEQTDDVAEATPSAPEAPKEGSAEHIRSIMAKARAVKTEVIPEPTTEIPPGPDELATKLAQLKHFGIGGVSGVARSAAQAAVADLHPTGRDVWKWSPPMALAGVSDEDLDSTAYQLLVKCMDGLPEQYGYDYKEDVLATAGFVREDVDAALRQPHRVEIRPESWDKEKRYPVLGFHRGDVSVILGMRTPEKPRVIAAYWGSMLQADTHHVNRSGGGGSKKSTGLPTNPGQVMARLREKGCEIPEPVDEKPVEVTYKGQSLGKIMTARTTTKVTAQTDYQRTLRKMQAIDRREAASVPA